MALAYRLQDEGHTVYFYVHQKPFKRVGLGVLAHHLDDPLKEVETYDLAIFDSVGAGGLADSLRERGLPVFGASRFQDLLELDRIAAMRLFEQAGLTIPPTFPFPSGDLDEAKDFVTAQPGAYVFKPSGNVGTDKTYLAQTPEEMLEFLEHLEASAELDEGGRCPFLLQEVVTGIEVSTERWYAAGEPVDAFDNVTFEMKKFLVGDLGPATGCAGNLVVTHPSKAWMRKTVGKLDRLAAKFSLAMCLDTNTIYDPKTKHAYVLEATCRFGYDAIQTFASLWKGELGTVLFALATGHEVDTRLRASLAAGVRVSVPPYPHHDASSAKGTIVPDPVLDDPAYWPLDIMIPEGKDRPEIAGTDGTAFVYTAIGSDAQAACARVYHTLDASRLNEKQYRTDLWEHVAPRLATLRQEDVLA